MCFTLYDCLLLWGIILYSPFYLRRMRKNKDYMPDLLQRIGLHPPEPPRKRHPRVLIHAVSVGETRAVLPILKGLRDRRPDWEIFLTTTTGTGRRTAEQIGVKLDGIYYFPVDLSFVCADFLRRLRPDIVCLAETELWPNFIRAVSRRNISLCLLNGRLSDKSYRHYRIFRPVFKPMLKKFDLFCMQSALDADRIIDLGAQEESVVLTGNIKFDMGRIFYDEGTVERLRGRLGLKTGQRVIVAGSTHPGEEDEIISAFVRFLHSDPDLVLILAPRHVERAGDIVKRVLSSGRGCLLWSKLAEGKGIGGGDVLLIDIIGILAQIYSIATVVFIGGSLIPHGGQNPLEPAYYGRPVIFGPHMENFRSIAGELLKNGAAIEVNPGSLFDCLKGLLADEEKRENMGRAGQEVVRVNQGAAKKTCDHIIQLLKGA